mmetsp:Transcript_116389/g.202045  ORF Transcript_116389/g.202045 Transcript_116389/m.202045 type:complete len:114 (-) Transcript_116389:194-535(-)
MCAEDVAVGVITRGDSKAGDICGEATGDDTSEAPRNGTGGDATTRETIGKDFGDDTGAMGVTGDGGTTRGGGWTGADEQPGVSHLVLPSKGPLTVATLFKLCVRLCVSSALQC